MYYGKKLLKKSLEKFSIPKEEATNVLEKAEEKKTITISVKGVKGNTPSALGTPKPPPMELGNVPAPSKPKETMDDIYKKNRLPSTPMKSFWDKDVHKLQHPEPIKKTMEPEPLEKGFVKNAIAGGAIAMASMGAHAQGGDLGSKLNSLNVVGEYITPQGSGSVLKERHEFTPSAQHPDTSFSKEGLHGTWSAKFHGPDAHKAHSIFVEHMHQNEATPLAKSDKYHLMSGGHRVSDKPMEMTEIEKLHGPKDKLLAAGITFDPVYDRTPVQKPQKPQKLAKDDSPKPKTQWYAQKKGCDKWHKVNDIVYNKGGYNDYHLEGHDKPLHQNEIVDLVTAKELNKSNPLKVGLTGLAVLASSPAQAPTVAQKESAPVVAKQQQQEYVHEGDSVPGNATVRQHTGKDFTEFKVGDAWHVPTKVAEQLDLMKKPEYNAQYGDMLRKLNNHRKSGSKKEGYIYP